MDSNVKNKGLGRCKTCKHWHRYEGLHAGECGSEKFVNSGDLKTPKNGLRFFDYDDYFAGFDTGEDFGCVHWELDNDSIDGPTE